MSTTDVKTTPKPPLPPLHGPWPMVSPFGRRWPGPGRAASPATVLAVLFASVVAALSVPLDRGGVGWLVTALAGTAAVVVARLIPHRPHSTVPFPALALPARRDDPARYGWATVTVLLLGVGTVRAAGWLVLLCLATACLTGTLAVAGGRSVRAMAVALLMAIGSGFRALPWMTRGLDAIRSPGRGRDGTRIAATVAVSIALLVVFGSLFASADAGFANLLRKAGPDIDAATVTRWIFVFVVTLGILGGAAYLRAAPPNLSGMDGGSAKPVSRLEWAIPLTLLVLLFTLFVALQLAVLFGDSRYVLDTAGLTYAEYARSGFWELLVVTGLTLLVLAGAVRWAPRATTTDRALIRAILGALAVLTLVIVASALHRMNVYAGTYGLTRLRILVALCELWLGVTFLLVIVAGIRLRAAWLPRVVVAAGVLALLGLAAANPDRLIAEQNITRYEETGRIDLGYLADLSADAVPALLDLPQPLRDCAVLDNHDRLTSDPGDWRGWSYGRAHAADLLRGPRPQNHPACASSY
ncbi:MAG TPA: DUF4173 domain-containing protein [Actinoplanes sp.]|nr:DUF4173 domain-containing protein [Actinoplanes sp.]